MIKFTVIPLQREEYNTFDHIGLLANFSDKLCQYSGTWLTMQIKDEEESNIEFDGASSDTASKKGGFMLLALMVVLFVLACWYRGAHKMHCPEEAARFISYEAISFKH